MLVHGMQNGNDTIETVILFRKSRAFRPVQQGSGTNLIASIHGSLYFLDSMLVIDT